MARSAAAERKASPLYQHRHRIEQAEKGFLKAGETVKAVFSSALPKARFALVFLTSRKRLVLFYLRNGERKLIPFEKDSLQMDIDRYAFFSTIILSDANNAIRLTYVPHAELDKFLPSYFEVFPESSVLRRSRSGMKKIPGLRTGHPGKALLALILYAAAIVIIYLALRYLVIPHFRHFPF